MFVIFVFQPWDRKRYVPLALLHIFQVVEQLKTIGISLPTPLAGRAGTAATLPRCSNHLPSCTALPLYSGFHLQF